MELEESALLLSCEGGQVECTANEESTRQNYRDGNDHLLCLIRRI